MKRNYQNVKDTNPFKQLYVTICFPLWWDILTRHVNHQIENEFKKIVNTVLEREKTEKFRNLIISLVLSDYTFHFNASRDVPVFILVNPIEKMYSAWDCVSHFLHFFTVNIQQNTTKPKIQTYKKQVTWSKISCHMHYKLCVSKINFYFPCRNNVYSTDETWKKGKVVTLTWVY